MGSDRANAVGDQAAAGAESVDIVLRFRRVRTARDGSQGDRYSRLPARPALGGEAGLRLGEMVALEWTDIDLVKRQLCVERSSWKGQVAAPKGGRLRYVPLTIRLARALHDHRHLRGPRGAHPSLHVLLAPGDAWRARTGHSGARRPQGSFDVAAVHAPQPSSDRERDSAARSARSRKISWRCIGNG